VTYYVPGTEETDQKKVIMSLQQTAGNTATNTTNIATNTTNIAANTAAITALTPKVAKAWVSITGATGAILASHNIASVVRNSAGVYTITFTTPFATADYATLMTSEDALGGATQVTVAVGGSAKTASVLVVATGTPASILTDPTRLSVVCFGTQ